MAAPLAIFLDEPTSGLDSTTALDLSILLRSASRLGLTIVSVIHQPRVEIFEAFDDVLLIAPGGRTAYFGPVNRVQHYFEDLGFLFPQSSNIADVLMDILSGRGDMGDASAPKSTEEIVSAWSGTLGKHQREQEERWLGSSSVIPSTALTAHSAITGPMDRLADNASVQNLAQIARKRGAGMLHQIVYAHNRSLRQQARHAGAFFLEAFVGFFAGFIMGVSANSPEPYLGILINPYVLTSGANFDWFLGLYGMLIGISIALAAGPAGVTVFGEERTVYWREAASGHNKFSYYTGKTISAIYRLSISSLHFTAIYYFLAKPATPLDLQFVLVLLNFFCVYGVAAVISMVVRREKAPLIAVIVGLFMAVFCGFGLSLTSAAKGGYLFLFNMGGN
ncbi:hypothetical protein HDU67_004660, partial [Dinochytrium kinnereticum]